MLHVKIHRIAASYVFGTWPIYCSSARLLCTAENVELR